LASTPELRFRADQTTAVTKARELRAQAKELRERVSQGSYDTADLGAFWALVSQAGVTLVASNTELSGRADLGTDFFASVARDRRRPKLTNFLRALSAIIEMANERLLDVDTPSVSLDIREMSDDRDWEGLFMLATSLSQLAHEEAKRIAAERPNDPDAIAKNKSIAELLELFRHGFFRLSLVLKSALGDEVQKAQIVKANKVAQEFADQVGAWWTKNSAEAVDWAIRVPAMAAGIGLLSVVGAPMAMATPIIAAMVGGKKAIDALRNKGRASRSKKE
jgi:hypothetical protein